MGIFNLFFGNRYGNMSEEYRAALRQLRKQRSAYYRGVRIAVIFASILSIVLLVLCLIVEDLRKPALVKFCFVVLALSFGGAACLPWITQIERDKKRRKNGEAVKGWHFYLAYAFFAFIGICTILWVIAVFVVGDNIITKVSDGNDIPKNAFTFLRAAIIITIQAVYGSVIATSILRHGKSYLVLHIIMFVTLGYLDFWLSWVAGGITVNKLEAGNFPPINNPILWVLAVLTGVALIIAASILSSQTRRKEIELIMKGDVKTLTEGDADLIDAKAATANMYRSDDEKKPSDVKSPEEQLAKIAELRDKGLITEEEYAQKRQDIINKL